MDRRPGMMRRSVALVAASLLFSVSYGCSTFYSTQYYKVSGTVVDASTGAPVPRAAIYIAESKKDLFGPLRVYKDEVPWYVKGPVYVDTSELQFGRSAQNRYLFLMADENGKFVTVWRHDVVRSGIFPFNLFGAARLRGVAFAVGAPGHSDKVVEYTETRDGKAFAGSADAVRMADNALAAIPIAPGESGGLKHGPIQAAYLRVRYPAGPGGAAKDLFEQAEKAFSQQQFGQALNLYDSALKESPDQPLILLMQMDALYRMGRYQDTLNAGARYLHLYPDVGFAHKIIADSAYRLGELGLSKQHMVIAMQLDPEFPSSLLSLVLVDRGYAEMPARWLPVSDIWTAMPTGPAPTEWRVVW
jgi:tetratricopeptide (TPR) repeat protein